MRRSLLERVELFRAEFQGDVRWQSSRIIVASLSQHDIPQLAFARRKSRLHGPVERTADS